MHRIFTYLEFVVPALDGRMFQLTFKCFYMSIHCKEGTLGSWGRYSSASMCLHGMDVLECSDPCIAEELTLRSVQRLISFDILCS